jgi:hypothetical protein
MKQDIEQRVRTVIDRLDGGTPWCEVREDLINTYYDLVAGDEPTRGPNSRGQKLEDLLRASLDMADPGANGEPEALLRIDGKQVTVSFSATSLTS